MSDENQKGHRPQRELAAPEVKAQEEQSAGLSAVGISLGHVVTKAGTRGVRALRLLNQHQGYDCPSCAWPDPDDERSSFEFCENGAKAVASETMPANVNAAFFEAHSIDELAAESDMWLDRQGRIAEPVFRDEGASHYAPISWDRAFSLIADEIAESAPERCSFYTSGRASNEAAFLYQLFARNLGTNNLPDCSNMCHESSGKALGAAIGIGKGTVSMADLECADVILVAGQNPGTNHPRMLSTLQVARENGAHIVAINPLREAGLVAFSHPQKVGDALRGMLGNAPPISHQHLQVDVNGDQALFRGIAKALLELDESGASVLDRHFLREHTAGFDDYVGVLREASFSELERLSGISESDIRALAARIAEGKKRLITCWAMGLTQHKNAVDTLREVVNMHLLIGAIGREGAGFCPVRGHSNVQGDRTVGICEKMPESFYSALDDATGITSPREHGHDTVGALLAMHDGEVDVFVSLGGNMLQAAPDTDFVARGLKRTKLTVQISTKLNRSHLITGSRALILPCLGRSEQDVDSLGNARFVTCENSMGIVQSSRGRLAPVSPKLKSEVDIIRGIAKAVLTRLGKSKVDWDRFEDYAEVRRSIELVVPGFSGYEARAQEPGGFYLPNAAKKRKWNTANGKASFSSAPVRRFEVSTPGRFVLQTLRSHDQFNTTVYGADDRYRGIKGGRRVVLMAEVDMARLRLSALDLVDVTSHFEGQKRQVRGFRVVPYDVPEGSLAAYFPEANPLIPIGSYAELSRTPTSKSVEVSVVPSGRRSDDKRAGARRV